MPDHGNAKDALVLLLDDKDDELEQLGREGIESVLWRARQVIASIGGILRGRFGGRGHGASRGVTKDWEERSSGCRCVQKVDSGSERV